MLKSAKIQFFKSQYNNWYCQNVIQIFLALLSFFATSSETYQYFQGRRSNQCHRAMARVDFLPRSLETLSTSLVFLIYKPRFSDCQSKSLEASEVALVVFTADRRPWE